jgi:outer membrane protein assembly factor BamA
MLLLKGSSRFAYTTAVGAVYYFCGRYSGGASTWIPTDFMKLQLSGSEMWGIASGTATTNAININLNLNFTGGTSTVRGIYYNPTLTSMVGTTHYAFHSTSGRIRFEGLPTSSAGLSAGDIWNDAGTLKIV